MFSLVSTSQVSAIREQPFQNNPTIYQGHNLMAKRYALSSPRTFSHPNAWGLSDESQEVGYDQEHDHEDLRRSFASFQLSKPGTCNFPRLKDVVGLQSAKQEFYGTLSLREQSPDLFRKRRSSRNILLYGPSGAGKSYLSKAVAAESNSSFLSVAASDLLSVSRENCENVVKEMFASARDGERVVFCLDEVDDLFSTDLTEESETLGRVKGQLLRELRTLQESSLDLVFIATSRSPWLLDEAFLCRMDRLVHVGLPDDKSRTKILHESLRDIPHVLKAEDIRNLATECETYSVSDMKALALDVKKEPSRIVQDSTHFRSIWARRNGEIVRKMRPCDKEDYDAIEMKHTDIQEDMLHVPLVTCLDFEVAMDRIRPSVSLETLEKHSDFTRRRGEKRL